MSALAALLPDGRRLHLQHGPIDLIVEAFGTPDEVRAAYVQATSRFRTVLDELVSELPLLRTAVGDMPLPVAGSVARRMVAACERHRPRFLTPMAAVAGAVADEVLAAMLRGRTLARAYVNDGGDIALHLSPGTYFAVGIVERLNDPRSRAQATIAAASGVRGVATSGQGGRSFSLGIADAVTVLAANAAAADAAATLIANAVDLKSPAVLRQPASALQEDTDLGDRLVVVEVGALSKTEIDDALAAGAAEAERMRRQGLIVAAFLSLRGKRRVVGIAEQALIAA